MPRITSYNVCYTKLLRKPELIDLNFGCPVKKIAGKGAGAGLLQNLPLLIEIVITSYSIHYTKLYECTVMGCLG